MSSSQTASRVLRWLRFSRAETNLKFLDNQHFVRALTPFIIAEDFEGVAWEWITRSVTERSASWTDALRIKRASRVLTEMVRIKNQPQYGDLDAAISTILDAEQRFNSSPLLPDLLILPWRSVSWLSAVEACNQATPTEKLFNAHVATADLLSKSFAVERAHLNLHHPTRPDHSAALRFFSDRPGLRKLIQSFRPLETNMSRWTGMSMISWISVFGQDTVNHLARLGRR